jgi:predicted small secreted protein
MKAIIGLVALSALLTACATTRDYSGGGDALVADTPAAQCDAAGRRVSGPAETAADSPFTSSGWTDAREWEVATFSSKAQIDRDVRQLMYRDCLHPFVVKRPGAR